MRGEKPYLKSNLKTKEGVDDVIEWIKICITRSVVLKYIYK